MSELGVVTYCSRWFFSCHKAEQEIEWPLWWLLAPTYLNRNTSFWPGRWCYYSVVDSMWCASTRMVLDVEKLVLACLKKMDVCLPEEWGKVILQTQWSSFISSSWSPPKYRSASSKASSNRATPAVPTCRRCYLRSEITLPKSRQSCRQSCSEWSSTTKRR